MKPHPHACGEQRAVNINSGRMETFERTDGVHYTTVPLLLFIYWACADKRFTKDMMLMLFEYFNHLIKWEPFWKSSDLCCINDSQNATVVFHFHLKPSCGLWVPAVCHFQCSDSFSLNLWTVATWSSSRVRKLEFIRQTIHFIVKMWKWSFELQTCWHRAKSRSKLKPYF